MTFRTIDQHSHLAPASNTSTPPFVTTGGQTQVDRTTLLGLPKDLGIPILEYLNRSDVVSLCATSKIAQQSFFPHARDLEKARLTKLIDHITSTIYHHDPVQFNYIPIGLYSESVSKYIRNAHLGFPPLVKTIQHPPIQGVLQHYSFKITKYAAVTNSIKELHANSIDGIKRVESIKSLYTHLSEHNLCIANVLRSLTNELLTPLFKKTAKELESEYLKGKVNDIPKEIIMPFLQSSTEALSQDEIKNICDWIEQKPLSSQHFQRLLYHIKFAATRDFHLDLFEILCKVGTSHIHELIHFISSIPDWEQKLSFFFTLSKSETGKAHTQQLLDFTSSVKNLDNQRVCFHLVCDSGTGKAHAKKLLDFISSIPILRQKKSYFHVLCNSETGKAHAQQLLDFFSSIQDWEQKKYCFITLCNSEIGKAHAQQLLEFFSSIEDWEQKEYCFHFLCDSETGKAHAQQLLNFISSIPDWEQKKSCFDSLCRTEIGKAHAQQLLNFFFSIQDWEQKKSCFHSLCRTQLSEAHTQQLLDFISSIPTLEQKESCFQYLCKSKIGKAHTQQLLDFVSSIQDWEQKKSCFDILCWTQGGKEYPQQLLHFISSIQDWEQKKFCFDEISKYNMGESYLNGLLKIISAHGDKKQQIVLCNILDHSKAGDPNKTKIKIFIESLDI